MKFSKLLVPALSIAGVGAIVAPIVTSCSSSGITLTEVTGKTGYYQSGIYNISAGQTVTYKGAKMQADADSCSIVTATASGTLAKVTAVKINGTKVTVEAVEYGGVVIGYSSTLPTGLKAGDALTIEVTYEAELKQAATVIAIQKASE